MRLFPWWEQFRVLGLEMEESSMKTSKPLTKPGNHLSTSVMCFLVFCLSAPPVISAAEARTYDSPYVASDAQGDFLTPPLSLHRVDNAASDSLAPSQGGTQLVWDDKTQSPTQPTSKKVAFAQEAGDDDGDGDGDEGNETRGSHLAFMGQPASVLLGIGTFVNPAYEGARKMEVLPFPFLDVKLFDGRAFLSMENGLGVNVVKNKRWKAGFAIGYSPGRSNGNGLFSAKTSRLNGVPDISDAAFGRGFVSYDIRPFSVDAALNNRFGPDGGVTATLGAQYHFSPIGRLHMSVGPEVTWADREYTETFFGVSEQTARTATALGNNMRAYSPNAGIKDVSFLATGIYKFDDHWNVMGRAGFSELVGPAKNSPLTEETFQPTVGVGIAYNF